MLVPSEWGSSENSTTIENNEVLESELSSQHKQELEVVEESLEDVEIPPAEFS